MLIRVSQVLRHYLTVAFSLPPGELTSAEFCLLIGEDKAIGPELAADVTGFLRRCDERKFAPRKFSAGARRRGPGPGPDQTS